MVGLGESRRFQLFFRGAFIYDFLLFFGDEKFKLFMELKSLFLKFCVLLRGLLQNYKDFPNHSCQNRSEDQVYHEMNSEPEDGDSPKLMEHGLV